MNRESNQTKNQQATEFRELLADVQHDIWSHWMKYMFSQGSFTTHMSFNDKPDSITWTMPSDKVERWQRQMETDYFDLTEKERESDREQADKVTAVLENVVSVMVEKLLDKLYEAPGFSDWWGNLRNTKQEGLESMLCDEIRLLYNRPSNK